MDKLKEMDNRQLGVLTAVVIGILGVIGIVSGNNVTGIAMLVLQALTALYVLGVVMTSRKPSDKTDKYRKLFMNLPIGFAQAKIIMDHTGEVIGYQVEDANNTFGGYF